MSLQHVANVPQDLRAPVAMQQVDLLRATSLSDLDNLRQSHLHQIFTSDMPPQHTTTFSLDKGLHAGPRELPSRAPFGTQWYTAFVDVLQPSLYDSF